MFKEILENINSGKRILITAHQNPDGDAIGSGLALLLALNKLNENGEKTIRFILEDKVPDFLMFLEHSFLIEKQSNVDTEYDFDTVICLDSAEIKRIGTISEYIKSETLVINIDHHISNTKYGKINFINEKYCSTSEIVYDMIKEMGIEIDINIAEAVYCGIVNDTGNFAHGNVTEKTFLNAYELKKAGVDNEKINTNLYGSKSMIRMKLLGKALSDFNFIEDKKIAYFYISYEEMQNLGAKKEDAEGLVESLRSYEKADIALFLRGEENGLIKGSLRSKEADVNVLAALFGGGGHKKASGFNTDKTVEEILNIIQEKLNLTSAS